MFSAARRGSIHKWADSRGTMSRFGQTRKKSRLPFASVHLAWCVNRNQNSSSAPGWSGLVAIVGALATRELGCSSWVGRWNDGGVCAVLLCCCVMSVVVVVVAVAVVLLFVYVWLRVLGSLSSKRSCARPRGRDASHRRQHCCARIEDRAYCGVKLHLGPGSLL